MAVCVFDIEDAGIGSKSRSFSASLTKTGHITSVRFSFAFFGVTERFGDFSSSCCGLRNCEWCKS